MITYEPPAMNSIKDGLVIAKRKAIESDECVCCIINDVKVYVSKETTIEECLKRYFEGLRIRQIKESKKWEK